MMRPYGVFRNEQDEWGYAVLGLSRQAGFSAELTMLQKKTEHCEIWFRPVAPNIKNNLRQASVQYAQFVAVCRRDGRWHEISRSMPIQIYGSADNSQRLAPSEDIVSHVNALKALVADLKREGWRELLQDNAKWWQREFARTG